MAGFTQDDLETVEDAIRVILAGTDENNVVTVTLQDRVVSYNRAKLPELRELRAEIKAEVDAAKSGSARRPRIYRSQFSKGL